MNDPESQNLRSGRISQDQNNPSHTLQDADEARGSYLVFYVRLDCEYIIWEDIEKKT